MKLKYIGFLIGMVFLQNAWACPACEKQQPKLLKGITHGTGPQSNWDWVIISVMAIVTVLVLVLSVKCLVKPNEKSENHIKRSIISNYI